VRRATVERTSAGAIVRFAEPEIGVSPGQACVIYDGAGGSRVLGGGFIRRDEGDGATAGRA
jgi:tRNA-specific 2-thiouridylase